MSTVRFGIVGSGLIAGVTANAIRKISAAKVVAVASRRPENATAFAEEHVIDLVFNTLIPCCLSNASQGRKACEGFVG